MSDLEDAFGSDFVQRFKQERQKRRAERQRIEDDEMKKIAALAVNGGKMDAKNPMFTYTSDTGVTHDVMLVTVPDPDNRSYWSLKTDGNEGSVSLPLDYLGEWIWSWFNDRDLAKKLEPGEDFLVAGRLDDFERDDGTVQDTLSPVRGLAPIAQVKQWADRALEEDGFDVPEQPGDEEPAVLEGSGEEEQAPEEPQELQQEAQQTQESPAEPDQEEQSAEDVLGTPDSESAEQEDPVPESQDDAGQFSDMLEQQREGKVAEEEQEKSLVPYEDVKEQIEDIAADEQRVWQLSEDEPALLDKLVNMVGNRLDYDTNNEGAVADKDIAVAIREHALTVIEEHADNDSSEEDNLF